MHRRDSVLTAASRAPDADMLLRNIRRSTGQHSEFGPVVVGLVSELSSLTTLSDERDALL